MTRASSIPQDLGLPGKAGFSRQPLTPEQQMQALKRVQAQAEHRVKLGMQLFKAAEARLSSQTDIIQQIKTLQKQLREQVNQDVAQSLHQYDQWIGQIDESFTTAIRKLEEKIDAVQANLVSSENRMKSMLDRAEALLDQSRHLMERTSLRVPSASAPDMESKTQAPEKSADLPPVLPPVLTQVQPFVMPPAAPQPVVSTDKPTRTDHAGNNATPTPLPLADHDEKIYSKLLQRLIEDTPQAKPADEDPDANAHAA